LPGQPVFEAAPARQALELAVIDFLSSCAILSACSGDTKRIERARALASGPDSGVSIASRKHPFVSSQNFSKMTFLSASAFSRGAWRPATPLQIHVHLRPSTVEILFLIFQTASNTKVLSISDYLIDLFIRVHPAHLTQSQSIKCESISRGSIAVEKFRFESPLV